MRKTYRISRKSIGRYELEAAASGCCEALASISFACDGEEYIVETDDRAQDSFGEWFKCGSGIMFDGYMNLLFFLREMCKSVILAADYLVPEDHLSYRLEDLFVENDRIKLIPTGKSRRFDDSVHDMLKELEMKYDGIHADYLASRLPADFDASSLLRILTGMILDLRVL